MFLITALAVGMAARASYTVLNDSLGVSELYPGTVHYYQIAVPDAWDATSPAALYVGLDGQLCNAVAVIDSLVTAGVMPPAVCVFLQPGTITGDDGVVLRYNRSNEFDATDARFATFLETELLPLVEGRELPDGRKITLTRDPSQRCIFGLSSGGIAAFTAAFHRPDLFGLVFSGCGTFVPMRGGDGWPAIVRKLEPRPVKVFLQDGFSDTWNPVFGSWYEANRMLASALEYAGYRCAFDWAEGGHSVRRATEIFPRVMEWLWTPTDTIPVPGNTFLSERLVPGEDWIPCDTDVRAAAAEATYPDGSFTVDFPGDGGWLWQHINGSDGARLYSQRFYWLHSMDNCTPQVAGMEFDSEGWLWVLTSAGLQVCDHNGRVRAIVAVPAGTEGFALGDGCIYAVTPGGTMRRVVRVTPATEGTRPRSQGQG